jgi:lipopolysaccharide assembly protein A
MRLLKSIILVIFLLAIGIFTFQNMEIVRIGFLNYYLEIPLSLASVSLYILGAISGGLLYSILKKLSFDDSKKRSNKTY